MPTDPRSWGALFVMGLLNNAVPFSLIFWGQTQIASGLASILNATTPLFTVLVAHVATSWVWRSSPEGWRQLTGGHCAGRGAGCILSP